MEDGFLQPAFKQAELNPNPVIFTSLGNAAQALGIERADATDTDRKARRVAAAIGSEQGEPDPTLDQRTAEAAARIGIDPATVGAKREKTGVDDRAAEAAKLIGLPGYPSGSSE